jgi:hypothetical protein
VPTQQPSYRAVWTKFAIQAINRSPQRVAIRERIGESTLAQIRASTMLDWLPFGVHLAVMQAVHDVLGRDGARAFWRERLQASLDTKLMAPIAHGSTLMFGDRLYGCFKMGIYAYRLIARDAGELAVEQSRDGIAIRFTGMPAAVVDASGWHALCHGQCEATIEYARARAEIDLTDRTHAGYVYRIRPV